MPSKCFVCGARPAVIDGWCAEDWNAAHALVKLPPKLELTVCSRCGRAKIAGKWQTWDTKTFLREKAKISGRLDAFDVIERDGKYVVRMVGLVERGLKPKIEEHTVIIRFNKVVCPDCSRAAGGYYEAVLQLRGKIPEGAMRFFEREAAKISVKDPRAFYSIKELKEGIDIRIGSTSAANKLAELLKRKYGAEIKKSYQLVGRRDSRNVYRTIISVRFPAAF